MPQSIGDEVSRLHRHSLVDLSDLGGGHLGESHRDGVLLALHIDRLDKICVNTAKAYCIFKTYDRLLRLDNVIRESSSGTGEPRTHYVRPA